ncbi:hypothetical protein [Synechococcus sp. PCC 7335]|uniref:hypothetical protein n=1 Tax=Synechococcus sp. (strain ATCC 29403 / PCC 7335) TaxID=91464 RepID=UPI0012F76FC1|nr:hypothetical protein [Synechococcus sp. PCC 7335]
MRSGLQIWVWEETRTQLNLATPRRCSANRGGWGRVTLASGIACESWGLAVG